MHPKTGSLFPLQEAGPRGFEPLVFGFLPYYATGGRRLNPYWATDPFLLLDYSFVRSSFIHQAFFLPDFSPA